MDYLYIKYERTDGRGVRHGRTYQVTPALVLPLILRDLRSYISAIRARVADARSTPTSRIRFRPLVLDRHPGSLRGVESSNLSRVRAPSPFPLYHATRARASVSLDSRASSVSSTNRIFTELCIHLPPLGGIYATVGRIQDRRRRSE